MSTLSSWAPYDSYVQGGLRDGRYLSATFTLLAAGPPRLSSVSPDLAGDSGNEFAWPIGVVQNFNLSQNRQFARFWEVGSERSYFISSRTVGQLGLTRVMYHGPSLLRSLYAFYTDVFPATVIEPIFENTGYAGLANKHDVIIPPGYRNVFLNLASDLFSQPMGLLMYFRDSNVATVSAGYLEQCYVPTHNLGTDAQGVVIQESVQLQYERLQPIDVEAVALIKGGLEDLIPDVPLPSGSIPLVPGI